jgi:predicted RNase H-like nuclease (RuvC/YqgF family)
MESPGYFFDTDNTKKKGKNFLIFFILLSVVLTIACVILAWQLIEFRNLAKQENTAKTEAITAKENLLHKLKNLELEYDELSKEYEGLDSVFTNEKTKITSLMEEIKNLKGSTDNYQEKVAELEKRLKDYVSKIEDLKSKNESLSSDNLKVKNTLDSVLNKNIEITSKNLTLADKIKIQAVLKASDMISEGIRFNSAKQETPTKMTKKAQRIKTCFSLTENVIAPKGYKVIYIRIAEPDGTILCLSQDDIFTFKGKNIIYSARKEIYYDNSMQDICVYWDKTKEFKKGTYYIDIFADDNLLGTSTLSLE